MTNEPTGRRATVVSAAAALTRPIRRRIASYRLVSPLERARERLREQAEAREERALLEIARAGRDVCWPSEDREPLVTVRIATYDRGQLIVDRAIASALRQTYDRLEVLVVGDCCDEPTEKAVRAVGDSRVRFINLPARGVYPDDRRLRWMVAGAAPMNAALPLARGAWIAPCDDDDEFTDDHVERLLTKALDARLEMVYSKALMEATPNTWWVTGSPRLAPGVSHGSALYSSGLRFMRHSTTSWKRLEPSDWNLWRRMRAAGVRIGFLDRVTYVHYLSVNKHPMFAGLASTPSPLVDGFPPGWVDSAPTERPRAAGMHPSPVAAGGQ
jgi:hypothetical protein